MHEVKWMMMMIFTHGHLSEGILKLLCMMVMSVKQ
jgi:hypothetical protein